MTKYLTLLLALVFTQPSFAAPFGYISDYADNVVTMLDFANGQELAKVAVGKGSQYNPQILGITIVRSGQVYLTLEVKQKRLIQSYETLNGPYEQLVTAKF